MKTRSIPIRLLLYLCLLGVSLFSAGCVTLKDPEASQEYRADIVGSVFADQSMGQTFVSRRAGLNGLQLWLRLGAGSDASGQLSIELFHTPEDKQPLVTLPLSFQAIPNNNQVSLTFPPQKDPPGQNYYFVLRTADGPVDLLGRSEEAYPEGQAYINGNPIQADLSFRTSYEYGIAAVMDDLLVWFSGLWLVIPLALTLWLPGRLLISLARLDQRLDWGERSAVSIGLSLALIPLLMTWTTTLGLQWSRLGVWAAAGMLGLAFIWQSRDRIIFTISTLGKAGRFAYERGGAAPAGMRASAERGFFSSESPNWPTTFTLAAILLISLAVRLAMVRDLAAPAWVDSVHHAMIARLVAEQGAFPDTYAPFLDVATASYHAGFHSVVTVFHWLSGLEIAPAMLLFGQVLNALAVLAVYLFTTTFVRDRMAGLAAALMTGLFTPMPAYYASWGRYTQLAGLLILPVAMVLVIGLLGPWNSAAPRTTTSDHQKSGFRRNFPTLILTAIACGGLFLTHYRVIAFLACLLLAFLAARFWQSFRQKSFWREMPREIGLAALSGIAAIGLTLPWWPATLQTLFIPTYTAGAQIQTPIKAFSDFSWGFLTTAFGKPALALAGLGLFLGIIRHRWFALILSLWIGLLFLIANLPALGLPGTGFVNNTSVEIMLFMPFSALGGFAVGWLISRGRALWPARWHKLYYGGLGLAGLAVALAGAQAMLPILNPVTMLFREADRPALSWIQEHIPPDETILINPFSWGYGLYAGSDGGYWITPIAGRKTMPPPVLYGLGNPEPVAQPISEVSRQALEKSGRPVELHDLLTAHNIGYVYIGARGGALSPRLLQESPLFRMLYAENGAWVFQVQQ